MSGGGLDDRTAKGKRGAGGLKHPRNRRGVTVGRLNVS